MIEWIECKLSEIGDVVGGATPSTKDESNYDGEISWLTPKDLSTFTERYIEKGERSITEKGFNSCSTKMLPVNSILFSSRAPIGYLAIAAREMCTNQGFKSVIPNDKVDHLFLYYLLKYKKNVIEGMGTGTTFKEVSGNVMKNIEVRIPKDKNEQKKIALILDSIDSRIENNNAINRNLSEQIAALYQAWFIDYEPFKNGDFVDSEVGEIPAGWRVEKLVDLCDTISKKHKFDKDELIFLNTGDVEDGKFLHANYSAVDGMPGQAKKSIKENDILYSEIRPINRHFAYVNFDAGDYVVSTKLMVIRSKGMDPRRLYQYLTSQSVIDELQLEAESRSGTFPQIRFENVGSLKMVVATDDVEKKYADLLQQFYAQIDKNVIENQRLVELRDSLLPKLMSGELDVSDLDI